MQWAADAAGTALGIERIGLAQRRGIQIDDGVEHWTRIIDGGDAIQIGPGQRA